MLTSARSYFEKGALTSVRKKSADECSKQCRSTVMGNQHQKGVDEDAPAFGSKAECMNKTCGSSSSKDLKIWAEWTEKQKLNFPEEGTFHRGRIENLRRELIKREKDKTTQKLVNWKIFGRWAEESLKKEEQAKSVSIR